MGELNATPLRKRHLLIIRHSPYGSSMARASVDLALAMGAFDQDFDLLFMGDGVLQLLKGQDTQAVGLKNIGKALSSLPLYDVERVFVDAGALSCHGVNEEQLVVPAEPLGDDRLQQLFSQYDHLVSC